MEDIIMCTICGFEVTEFDMDDNPADAHGDCETRLMDVE